MNAVGPSVWLLGAENDVETSVATVGFALGDAWVSVVASVEASVTVSSVLSGACVSVVASVEASVTVQLTSLNVLPPRTRMALGDQSRCSWRRTEVPGSR